LFQNEVNIQTRGIQYKISQSEQDEAGEILSESKTYTICHTVAKITKTRGSMGSARAVHVSFCFEEPLYRT
jgi:hypothetical protein